MTSAAYAMAAEAARPAMMYLPDIAGTTQFSIKEVSDERKSVLRSRRVNKKHWHTIHRGRKEPKVSAMHEAWLTRKHLVGSLIFRGLKNQKCFVLYSQRNCFSAL
jgi:hypothetical protein